MPVWENKFISITEKTELLIYIIITIKNTY